MSEPGKNRTSPSCRNTRWSILGDGTRIERELSPANLKNCKFTGVWTGEDLGRGARHMEAIAGKPGGLASTRVTMRKEFRGVASFKPCIVPIEAALQARWYLASPQNTPKV